MKRSKTLDLTGCPIDLLPLEVEHFEKTLIGINNGLFIYPYEQAGRHRAR